MSQPSISVVIPVYNEEQEIDRVLEATRSTLDAHGGPWEILVVDNASTDSTPARVRAHAVDERIRLLRNEANHGKGYSVRRGMLAAGGELRLMCDADCTPSLESLPGMIRAGRDADIVVGSRIAAGARVSRPQPIRRRIVGFGFLMLCRRVMGESTRDVFCGFKLWRGECAQAVFSRTRLDGWTFDAEALAMARALGYRVEEVGIIWVNRPASRLSIGRVLVPVVRELFEARRHIREEAARAALEPRSAEAAGHAPAPVANATGRDPAAD